MFLKRTLGLISKKGITKNKLLTDLKLSKNSFVDWEQRGTIPNGETLTKIAEYFNVSVDYLLGRTDEPAPQKTQPVVIMAKGGDGQDVIEVSEEQYQKIKKILELMDEQNL